MVIDGILGLTLFRFNKYQVQLFMAGPDVIVPEHTHPNVASYEVAIFGVELTHSGNVIVPMERSMTPRAVSAPWEIPVTLDYFKRLRVNTNDVHGGRSSPMGEVLCLCKSGKMVPSQHPWRLIGRVQRSEKNTKRTLLNNQTTNLSGAKIRSLKFKTLKKGNSK